MTYSSALFNTSQESLEKAQIAKYASMVDQMGVKPGDMFWKLAVDGVDLQSMQPRREA